MARITRLCKPHFPRNTVSLARSADALLSVTACSPLGPCSCPLSMACGQRSCARIKTRLRRCASCLEDGTARMPHQRSRVTPFLSTIMDHRGMRESRRRRPSCAHFVDVIQTRRNDAGFVTFLGKFGLALMWTAFAVVVAGFVRLFYVKALPKVGSHLPSILNSPPSRMVSSCGFKLPSIQHDESTTSSSSITQRCISYPSTWLRRNNSSDRLPRHARTSSDSNTSSAESSEWGGEREKGEMCPGHGTRLAPGAYRAIPSTPVYGSEQGDVRSSRSSSSSSSTTRSFSPLSRGPLLSRIANQLLSRLNLSTHDVDSLPTTRTSSPIRYDEEAHHALFPSAYGETQPSFVNASYTPPPLPLSPRSMPPSDDHVDMVEWAAMDDSVLQRQ